MATPTTFAAIVAKARRLRGEIDQLFHDVAHWNRAHPGEQPIDPDPDGQLRQMINRLESNMDTAPAPTEPDRFWLLREVLDRVPASPSTIMRWVRAGRFPAPIKLAGGRRNVWHESKVLDWIRRGGTT